MKLRSSSSKTINQHCHHHQLHLRITVLGIGHTHFSYLFALHTFLTVILLPACYARTVISLTLNFHVLVCVLTCLVYNKMNE